MANSTPPGLVSTALLAEWVALDPEVRAEYEKLPDEAHSMVFEVMKLVDVYRRWKISTPTTYPFMDSHEALQLRHAWETFINLFAKSWGYYLSDMFDMDKEIYLLGTPNKE